MHTFYFTVGTSLYTLSEQGDLVRDITEMYDGGERSCERAYVWGMLIHKSMTEVIRACDLISGAICW